jgi:hypothetical protein
VSSHDPLRIFPSAYVRRLGVTPKYMGISPVVAIPKLLSQFGLQKEDIDVYEVRYTLWIPYCREFDAILD